MESEPERCTASEATFFSGAPFALSVPRTEAGLVGLGTVTVGSEGGGGSAVATSDCTHPIVAQRRRRRGWVINPRLVSLVVH